MRLTGTSPTMAKQITSLKLLFFPLLVYSYINTVVFSPVQIATFLWTLAHVLTTQFAFPRHDGFETL